MQLSRRDALKRLVVGFGALAVAQATEGLAEAIPYEDFIRPIRFSKTPAEVKAAMDKISDPHQKRTALMRLLRDDMNMEFAVSGADRKVVVLFTDQNTASHVSAGVSPRDASVFYVDVRDPANRTFVGLQGQGMIIGWQDPFSTAVNIKELQKSPYGLRDLLNGMQHGRPAVTHSQAADSGFTLSPSTGRQAVDLANAQP